MRGLLPLAALAISACGAPPAKHTEPAVVASASPSPDMRDIELEKLRADNASLRLQLVNARRPAPAFARDDTPVDAAPAKPRVAMCFKDYCPCDPPQGGPDSVLCDQLEQGVEPDIQLMIAGRGMREARRQIATGDY